MREKSLSKTVKNAREIILVLSLTLSQVKSSQVHSYIHTFIRSYVHTFIQKDDKIRTIRITTKGINSFGRVYLFLFVILFPSFLVCRYLSGMREKYHKQGSPNEISSEFKATLGLSEPSQWTVPKLKQVQPRIAEPLVLYW